MKVIQIIPPFGMGVLGRGYALPDINIGSVYLYHCIVINVMVTYGLMHNFSYGIICYTVSFGLGIVSTKTVGRSATLRRQKADVVE